MMAGAPASAKGPEAGQDGSLLPHWDPPEGVTFEEALRLGADVVQRAREALPALPRKDPTRHYPPTMADAVALVHAREDYKKKKAASLKAQKVKASGSATAPADHIPGAVQGGGDPSAFWLYVEVRGQEGAGGRAGQGRTGQRGGQLSTAQISLGRSAQAVGHHCP